jgi:hypothetical protein
MANDDADFGADGYAHIYSASSHRFPNGVTDRYTNSFADRPPYVRTHGVPD